jgi:hypothetical protein
MKSFFIDLMHAAIFAAVLFCPLIAWFAIYGG